MSIFLKLSTHVYILKIIKRVFFLITYKQSILLLNFPFFPFKYSRHFFLNKSQSYVYMGEKGPYLPPKEPVAISQGRLLAGMYGISEVMPEKK